MKVNRTELLSDLAAVQPGLAKNEFLEQATCFVFVDGRVGTYNEKIRVVKRTCLTGITGAVPSEPLFKLLSRMDEEEVEIVADEGVLKIGGKSKEASIPYTEEIKLPIDDLDAELGEAEWKKVPEGFVQNLKLAGFSALNDSNESNFTCIHITGKFIESTDSFRVTRIAAKLPSCDILIPNTSCQKLVDFNPLETVIGENWAHFKCEGGTIFSCRLCTFDKPYPDMAQFMKAEGDEIKFPETLPEILDRASVFITVKDERNKTVNCHIEGGKMTVSAVGESGKFKETVRVRFSGKKAAFGINVIFLLAIYKLNPAAVIGERMMVFKAENLTHALSLAMIAEK